MPERSISSMKSDPTLLNILSETNLFDSKGQIRRLIAQGAVKLDGEKVVNADFDLTDLKKAATIKAGKKVFIRLLP